MNFGQVFSFVLASSALLGLAGATSAQELAATGTKGWLRLFGQISLRDKWTCLSG